MSPLSPVKGTTQMDQLREEYLGDGLYASFDGYQVCLRAPRENGDHVVYLDPYALAELDAYRKRLFSSPQESGDAS